MDSSLDSFLQNFAAQLENTDKSEIIPSAKFKDLDEWDSMIALSLIAMADETYNVRLTGDDIRNSSTIEELYNRVKIKLDSPS